MSLTIEDALQQADRALATAAHALDRAMDDEGTRKDLDEARGAITDATNLVDDARADLTRITLDLGSALERLKE